MGKKAQPGQKIRKIIGGADAVCTVAVMNALRAVRQHLVMDGERPDRDQAAVEALIEGFDGIVLGAMYDHLTAKCDMEANSPKDHWAKLKRAYKEPWRPPVEEPVTMDPNEDFDAWLDEVDGTMPSDPMDPFKAEGAKWAKEYARRGQDTGQKHFVRKVEIEGVAYLVVGCSSGDDAEGDVAHANGALGNVSFKAADESQVVRDKGELFKVYCKDYAQRTYWVQFLVHTPGQKFRLWWASKNNNQSQHYLIMDDSDHGFAKDPSRQTFRKAG